ncbi:SsgA family sporulation/cell division regulator [Streptomyces apocyni]|uniref:SsgA family sporulation/cell division regulator n=1 Tax=Streptomyces apocyni TaxID=2654677 RepID=UPI0012E9FF86|nr:SsgA family sporulation/cell division regulator [Streptomyces apocyni]
MSAVVEEHARAHIVSDSPDEHRAVPVDLRYDPESDPRTVRISFPGSTDRHEWAFTRELLERGLRTPARSGDVRIWPCGRVQAVMELHSPQGVALIEFDRPPLVRFLRRTYAAGATATH